MADCPKCGKSLSQKEIKTKLLENGVDMATATRNGTFIARREFFYTHGKTVEDLIAKITNVFPNAIIMDSGTEHKPFRGGGNAKQNSHWWVEFRLPKDLSPQEQQKATQLANKAEDDFNRAANEDYARYQQSREDGYIS